MTYVSRRDSRLRAGVRVWRICGGAAACVGCCVAWRSPMACQVYALASVGGGCGGGCGRGDGYMCRDAGDSVGDGSGGVDGAGGIDCVVLCCEGALEVGGACSDDARAGDITCTDRARGGGDTRRDDAREADGARCSDALGRDGCARDGARTAATTPAVATAACWLRVADFKCVRFVPRRVAVESVCFLVAFFFVRAEAGAATAPRSRCMSAGMPWRIVPATTTTATALRRRRRRRARHSFGAGPSSSCLVRLGVTHLQKIMLRAEPHKPAKQHHGQNRTDLSRFSGGSTDRERATCSSERA